MNRWFYLFFNSCGLLRFLNFLLRFAEFFVAVIFIVVIFFFCLFDVLLFVFIKLC